jgi:hypothetical protein
MINDLHQPPRRDSRTKKWAAVRGQFCMLWFGDFLPIKSLKKTVVCPRFSFSYRSQPKLRSIFDSEKALADIGRFQVMHNGHKIEFIHEDDDDLDWDQISTFTRVADFELSGHISRILRLVYPDEYKSFPNQGSDLAESNTY